MSKIKIKKFVAVVVLLPVLWAGAQFASFNDRAFLARPRPNVVVPPAMTNTDNLVMWLRPETLGTPGTRQTLWDNSAIGYDGFTNHVGGVQGDPPLVLANRLNGYKSAWFETTNALLCADFVSDNHIPLGFSNTVIMVLSYKETNEFSGHYLFGRAGWQFSWGVSTLAKLSLVDDASPYYEYSFWGLDSLLEPNGFHYFEWTRLGSAPTESRFALDHTDVGSDPGNNGLGDESTFNIIGNAPFELVEFLAWDRPLLPAERTNVAVYLSEKYGFAPP